MDGKRTKQGRESSDVGVPCIEECNCEQALSLKKDLLLTRKLITQLNDRLDEYEGRKKWEEYSSFRIYT